MRISKMKLDLAMADACMNKSDLANAAGISRISLGKYFSGKREPSPKTIGKIAKALDVPVIDIIENTAATVDNGKQGISEAK